MHGSIHRVTLRRGWKPRGFFPHGFSLWQEDCIPLTLQASYTGKIALTRGRCHHRRLLGGSNFTQILCVRCFLPFDTHRAMKTFLSGVIDSLVYPQWLSTRERFYPAPFVLEPIRSSVFKVLQLSSYTRRQKWKCRRGKGSNQKRLTAALQRARLAAG